MAEVTIITEKIKGGSRHWKNFLDKDYLGSHNIEKGEDMLLTISKFEGEETVKTQRGEEKKTVLYFKENVPKMILNITNGNMLSHLYGSHPEDWIDKQIQVYVKSIKSHLADEGLRFRDFIPKITVDVATYKAQLNKATTLEGLKAIWTALPTSARNDKEVEAEKNLIKTNIQQV